MAENEQPQQSTSAQQDPEQDQEQITPEAAENAAALLAYWEGAMSTPAVFVNHTVVMPTETGVRLAFGEQATQNAPIWMRTAVALGEYRAYQLWEELGRSEAVMRMRGIAERFRAAATEGDDATDE